MNDKIKTQIIGACRQQGCNDADAEHIAVSVLNTLQPLVADAARFRMMTYLGTDDAHEARSMMEDLSMALPQETPPEEEMRGMLRQIIDQLRDKFGDRP